MAIQYKYCVNESGRVISLGFAPPNYVVESGWKVGDCVNDELPEIETLHEQKYLDAQALVQYKVDRKAEYPSIAELTVALYDTDDKADIEAKRAAVKLKYPKPE